MHDHQSLDRIVSFQDDDRTGEEENRFNENLEECSRFSVPKLGDVLQKALMRYRRKVRNYVAIWVCL